MLDAKGGGGPAHVYGLTITTGTAGGAALADGLTETSDAAATHAAHGRAEGDESPGAARPRGTWRFKGSRPTFDLVARRAGSPLCGVLTVTDAAGKEIVEGRARRRHRRPDAHVHPAGRRHVHRAHMASIRSRGGPAFTYRLKVTPEVAAPGVKLAPHNDIDTVENSVAGEGRLVIKVERVELVKDRSSSPRKGCHPV